MSFWKWFMKSFFDKRTIAYSRLRPATSTIWHVLAAMLIASIPFLVTINTTAISGVQQLRDTLQHDIPDFQLEEGALQTETEGVYLSNQSNEGAILIDPANIYSQGELKQLTNGIALQQSEILFIDNGSIQAVPYSILGLQEFTKDQLSERIADLQGFLPILLVIATVLMYAGLAGLAFLGITLLGFIGLLLRGSRKSLEYRHLWLMTAHSLTLPVVLLYWVDTLFAKVPFSAFAAATLAILFLAIRSIPLPRKK